MHIDTLMTYGADASSMIVAYQVLTAGAFRLRKKLRPQRRYHGQHVKPGARRG